jgi:hypothetical protein
MWKKINRIRNKNEVMNVDAMLVSTFITTLFYSSTFPYINKQLMTVVSDKLIAFNQIISCLSVIISGFLWNKYSNKLYKHFILYCISEIVVVIFTTLYIIFVGNLTAYYIMDIFMYAIITRNISCGCNKLKILRYTEETEREHFNNNDNSSYAIATIIGSIVAMLLNLNFDKMVVLATIGNIIDNIFYIVIYKNMKNSKE